MLEKITKWDLHNKVLPLHIARVNLNTTDVKAYAVCKSFFFAFGMDCKEPLMVKGNNDPNTLPNKLIEILTLLIFWFSTFILINSLELM
jgi:hypothetical protein